MFRRIGREGGPGPFEFVILLFLVFGGLSTLTNLGAPTSLSKVLPPAILAIWTIILTLGAFIGFAGVVWLGRETTALLVEQVGLIFLAGAALIYSVVLLSQFGSIKGASVSASFINGFGVAALWRVFEIYKRQRTIVELSRHLDDIEREGE